MSEHVLPKAAPGQTQRECESLLEDIDGAPNKPATWKNSSTYSPYAQLCRIMAFVVLVSTGKAAVAAVLLGTMSVRGT